MTTDVYRPGEALGGDGRVKGRDTAPEWGCADCCGRWAPATGCTPADLPGKPDIVMAGRRLAMFVHGCFWHGHDCARGARVPKANRDVQAAVQRRAT